MLRREANKNPAIDIALSSFLNPWIIRNINANISKIPEIIVLINNNRRRLTRLTPEMNNKVQRYENITKYVELIRNKTAQINRQFSK